jgi:hypothetical protein
MGFTFTLMGEGECGERIFPFDGVSERSPPMF